MSESKNNLNYMNSLSFFIVNFRYKWYILYKVKVGYIV